GLKRVGEDPAAVASSSHPERRLPRQREARSSVENGRTIVDDLSILPLASTQPDRDTLPPSFVGINSTGEITWPVVPSGHGVPQGATARSHDLRPPRRGLLQPRTSARCRG